MLLFARFGSLSIWLSVSVLVLLFSVVLQHAMDSRKCFFSRSAQFTGATYTTQPTVPFLAVSIVAHGSACFNGDGSLIATTCRDGKIRILDSRSGTVAAEGHGHQGRKSMKAAWCFKPGVQEVLATTGCAAAGHRQLCLWDPVRVNYSPNGYTAVRWVACSPGGLPVTSVA